MSAIANEQAAQIVAGLRADIEKRDETTALEPPHKDHLLAVMVVKLYDDLQALTQATAFLGGGIKAPTRVTG